MAVKGSGRGWRIDHDGYVEFTRRGLLRFKKAHRVYMETLVGRPLRADEEVHHLCGNRSCWPPTDFHLALMDSALHHGFEGGYHKVRQGRRK